MLDDSVAIGKKVNLRSKRIEDAEEDYRWRIDAELAELDATVVLRQSFSDYLSDFDQELKFPTPWVKRYAIETHQGTHIGNCMLYDIDTIAGQCELGILVGDKTYWDFGYGREAVLLLMSHTFAATSMNLLYLHTLAWNARARRAFAGCGFKEIGPVRKGGRDFIRMEISRREWERLEPASRP